jgi:hypothetical protein
MYAKDKESGGGRTIKSKDEREGAVIKKRKKKGK